MVFVNNSLTVVGIVIVTIERVGGASFDFTITCVGSSRGGSDNGSGSGSSDDPEEVAATGGKGGGLVVLVGDEGGSGGGSQQGDSAGEFVHDVSVDVDAGSFMRLIL